MHEKSLRILTALFLFVLFGTTNAAELSKPYNWNGCYIGGTLGGNWAHSRYTGTPTGAWYFPSPAGELTIVPNLSAISSGTLSPSGVIGGGEVGYNLQVRTIVFGLEGEYLFVTLPNQRIRALNPDFPTFTETTTNRLRSSIVRFGVNYKFNL